MTRLIRMATSATYNICVQGCFSESWADWFEDTTIRAAPDQEKNPHTILTCRVKDQAALLGILMKLNGLNAPIISVSILDQDAPDRPAEKQGVTA